LVCTTPTIVAQPAPAVVCPGLNTFFTFNVTPAASFSYVWQIDEGGGYTNINNGGIYSNATTATLNLTGVTISLNGYLYRCVITNSCGDIFYSNAASLSINSGVITWTGASSTSYNTASNWNPATVPNANNDVIIPGGLGNYPVISALTINACGSLTIAPRARLTVNGYIVNDGTFTIQSSATGTGTLVNSGTFTGSGTSNVQQYITGNGTAITSSRWWYFASPVAGSTSAVYGTAPDNQVRTYTEAAGFSQLDLASPVALNSMQGYYNRFLGANKTINFTGGAGNHIYSGNQSVAITNGSAIHANNSYNMISNPYVAYLDFNAAVNSTIESSYWIRTHNLSSGLMVFDYYNSGGAGTTNSGGTPLNQYIHPMQSFWVKAKTGTTAPFAVTPAMTSHQTGTLRSNLELVRINLRQGLNSDQALIYFNENADESYNDYDTEKRTASGIPQLYTLVEDMNLVINGLQSPEFSPVVDLFMNIPADGQYTLHSEEIKIEGYKVMLEDKRLNEMHTLKNGENYNFYAKAGNMLNRFAVHFIAEEIILDETGINEHAANSVNVYQSNKNLVVNLVGHKNPQGIINVYDQIGRLVMKQQINGNTNLLNINNLNGVYIIQIQSKESTTNKKLIIVH
jgi:hypothetical protein